eukprot:5519269-Pleurochrysis_carterae.AAC.1
MIGVAGCAISLVMLARPPTATCHWPTAYACALRHCLQTAVQKLRTAPDLQLRAGCLSLPNRLATAHLRGVRARPALACRTQK